MSDLWDYELDDAQLSDSDTEAASRRRTANDAGFTAEALLPEGRRQKLRRVYGNNVGGLANSPTGRRGSAGARLADSDSDLELIEQAEARHGAGCSPGEAERAAALQAAARPALDEKSARLLANSRAQLHNLQRGSDHDDDDTGVEPSQEVSPVQLRHTAAAAAAAPAGAPGLSPGSAGAGKAPRGTPRIVLKLETSKQRSIQVRVRSTDKLTKAFDAFRAQAVAQGWVASADAKLRFEFDGDVLDGERDTPASLGMEDEDKIEVHML